MNKQEQTIFKTFYQALEGRVKSGDTVLCAVSGGVDSMVLMDLAVKMQDALGIRVAVGHIHHHLREASDAEWAFVEDACKRRGVPFYGKHIDVKKAQAESGRSMESAAHTLRHQALREIMAECGAGWILLAHHAGDRAETVLMNLLRGCALSGLSAMSAQNGEILRPLLGVTREEIEAYAQKEGLSWVTDESNSDTTILRNKLRHALIPTLSEYNPNIIEALNHLAETAEVAEDYISENVETLLREGATFKADKWCMLKRASLENVHDALLSAVIRTVVEHLSTERHSLHFEMVKQSVQLIRQGRGRYDLGGGLIIECTRQWVYIGALPEGEWVRTEAGYEHAFLEARLQLAGDAPFGVRFPQSGDSISLANLGHKRLKKIFQEKGLPSVLRGVWPLVYDIKTKEVIWAPFLARATLLMYYNSVTFSEVDLTITIACQSERLSIKARK